MKNNQKQSRSKKQSRKKQQNNRKMGILILLLLVVSISVGYAALSSVLNINGSSTVIGGTWDVRFTNLTGITKGGLTSDTGTGLQEATINSAGDQVDFAVSMRQPGDSYSFTVDVKNFGSLPANAKLEVTGLDGEAADYLTWTVTGMNSTGEELASLGHKTLTVTVMYKNDAPLAATGFDANLSAVVTAEQTS